MSVLGFGIDSSFESFISLLGSIRDIEEKGKGQKKDPMHHLITQEGERETLCPVHFRWESTAAPLHPTDHITPLELCLQSMLY